MCSSVAPVGNIFVGHRGPTLHNKLLPIIMPQYGIVVLFTIIGSRLKEQMENVYSKKDQILFNRVK